MTKRYNFYNIDLFLKLLLILYQMYYINKLQEILANKNKFFSHKEINLNNFINAFIKLTN
jgi:hypothetical protein